MRKALSIFLAYMSVVTLLPAANITLSAPSDGKTDVTATVQSAINSAAGGGVVTVPASSNCYLLSPRTAYGGSTVAVTLPSDVTIQGPNGAIAKFCSSNPDGGYMFGSLVGKFKFDSITFEGAPGILATGSGNPDHHRLPGMTITNNVFENYTSMNPNGNPVALWGQVDGLTYTGNTIQNIWPGGFTANGANLGVLFPNNVNGTPCYNSPDGSACDIGTGGLLLVGGARNTMIARNLFKQIVNDALNINVRPEQLSDATHLDGAGLIIQDNEFFQNHRIDLEFGGFGNCLGTNGACNFSLVPFQTPIIQGNYIHGHAVPWWHTFGLSTVFNGSINAQFIGNTVADSNLNPCYGGATGSAMEHAANSLLASGNVLAAPNAPCGKMNGYGGYMVLGGIDTLITAGQAVYQNNVVCGPNAGIGPETTSVPLVQNANFLNGSCPVQTLETSSIQPTVTASTAGTAATVNLAVKSTLSIRTVDYYLDNATTPLTEQRVPDYSTSFAQDLQWRFHNSIDTGSLSKGDHTVKVVVTDVSKATQTASVTITGTGGGTPPPPPPPPPTIPACDSTMQFKELNRKGNGINSGDHVLRCLQDHTGAWKWIDEVDAK